MSTHTYEFEMEMTCEGCSNAAKRVLGKLPDGDMKVDADLAKQKVTVTSILDQDQLLEALKKTGKPVKFVKLIS